MHLHHKRKGLSMKKLYSVLVTTFLLGAIAAQSIDAMEKNIDQSTQAIGAMEIDQLTKVSLAHQSLLYYSMPMLINPERGMDFTDKIKIHDQMREITWKLRLNDTNQIHLSFRDQDLGSLEGIGDLLVSFFADKEKQFQLGDEKVSRRQIFADEMTFSLDNVVSLDFACTNITEIDASFVKFVKGLKNLQNISFVGNKLTVLPDDFLVNSSTLECVQFDGNKLIRLPELLFNNTPALKSVSFDRNRLTGFPHNFLNNPAELTYFTCSYNWITEFPEFFLSNAPKLSRFYCDYNSLRSFPSSFMLNSHKMYAMSFEHNEIAFLPSHFMLEATLLYSLNGNDNQLRAFPAGSLANTPKLQKITFHNNRLQVFHHDFLANAPELYEVELQNNQIVQFPTHFVGKSSHLNFINISDNQVSSLPSALDGLDFNYMRTFVIENNPPLKQAFTGDVSNPIAYGKRAYNRLKQAEIDERKKCLDKWAATKYSPRRNIGALKIDSFLSDL